MYESDPEANPDDDLSRQGRLSDDIRALFYDLTHPPSRGNFGMQPGETVLHVSRDGGFEVTFALPEGLSTTLTARRVNADAYGSASPEHGDPTTVDVQSVALGVDQTVEVAQRIADDVGIDAGPLQRWRREVGRADDGSIDSPFMRATVGYLIAEMQVQHLGPSDTNYVHLIFTWI